MSNQLDGADSLVGILNRVQGWIVAADQKVSVITAIQTLVCGFLFPELKDWAEKDSTSTLVRIGLLVGTGFMLWGLGFSLQALFPVIEGPNLKSATFFMSIQSWSADEYDKHMQGMNDEAWRADYISQIQANSMIATRKFQFIQKAVRKFVHGLLVIAVCYGLAIVGL